MLPLEKAFYPAKAIACHFGESSNGNYQIGVTCIVTEGEYQNEQITYIGHFTEKTEDRTIESLQYFGWKGDDLAELANLGPADCERLLPEVVSLDCAPEEYDGNTTLKVQWVNRPGAGAFMFKKPLEADQLRGFAAQMRNKIRNAQMNPDAARKERKAASGNGSGGARPTQPTQRAPQRQQQHPNAPAGADDDLPF